MQFPTTSGGRTAGYRAGYRIGGDQSAGIPASPDGSAPNHVVARAAVEPDTVAVVAGDDAEAVVLDLVQPCPSAVATLWLAAWHGMKPSGRAARMAKSLMAARMAKPLMNRCRV
jgi:hypothetical protein